VYLVCVNVYAYIHTCLHPYIHTYIHTYTHTHVHTNIHSYKHTCVQKKEICIHTHAHTHTTGTRKKGGMQILDFHGIRKKYIYLYIHTHTAIIHKHDATFSTEHRYNICVWVNPAQSAHTLAVHTQQAQERNLARRYQIATALLPSYIHS